MQEDAGDADAWQKLYERKMRWIRAYTSLSWPVALGTHVKRQGCSCGRKDCAAPGAHRISRSTTQSDWLAYLLLYHPEANLLVATGTVVTAIEVPAPVAPETLLRIPTPVADTGRRTCLLLTAGEVTVPASRLRCYAHGSHVPLPPSRLVSGREMRWLRMPFGRPLLDPRAVIDEWKSPR